MSPLPKVTFALLSWNRLHYLRATLESALTCIEYPNMEWIVSDNASIEPGLQDYLNQHTHLDKVLCKSQTHAAAMNELIEIATGDYIFIWPEDVQFVVKGDWLKQVIRMMDTNPDIGSVGLDGQRSSTLHNHLHPHWRTRLFQARRDWKCFGKIRSPRWVDGEGSYQMFTLGGAMPGVCGSGIPTLTRRSLWQEMGGWRSNQKSEGLIDSSMGAEDRMVATFYQAKKPLQMAQLNPPVAADIITDTFGCKAKVRGPYRFGDYMPPPDGTFYYRIREQAEFAHHPKNTPISFSELTQPLGFSIPKDQQGDRLKCSFNASIAYHIAEGRPIPHPLSDQELVSRLS